MELDCLWPGGPQIARVPGVFPLGGDAVLLADFAETARCRRAADLGCGLGVISVLTARKSPALCIDAVDVSPAAVAATALNAELNGLTERIAPRLGDVSNYRALFTAGDYDLVLSNPPYFAAGRGFAAEEHGDARGEGAFTLSVLAAAAAYMLRWGGRLSLVYRPERLSELFCCLTAAGLEPKRLRLVQHGAESAPSLALVEARRGGKPGLRVLPPLLLTKPDGGDSDEVTRIYYR